jgi:Leucine-rich repeat (LRR) protein
VHPTAGGNLQDVISSLPGLQLVILSNANLSSPVPSISSMQSLQELWLDNNQLTGSVPSTLPNSLQQLVLTNNKLTGLLATLMSTDPGSSALMRLDLAGNNLHGPLPADLGTHPNIKYINLQANMLNGSLPSTVSC